MHIWIFLTARGNGGVPGSFRMGDWSTTGGWGFRPPAQPFPPIMAWIWLWGGQVADTKKYCVIAYFEFFIKWLRVSFRLWSITISQYFFGTMMILIRGEREGAWGGIVRKSCLLFTWESIRIIFWIIDAGLFLIANCILMSQAH